MVYIWENGYGHFYLLCFMFLEHHFLTNENPYGSSLSSRRHTLAVNVNIAVFITHHSVQ